MGDIIDIPGATLTNVDLMYYAKKLGINNLRGIFMRDCLPKTKTSPECGIMNFNESTQVGTHWVCWVIKQNGQRFYFDSYGQNVPEELMKYLKSSQEYKNDIPVVRRNALVIQRLNTTECGRLCLFVIRCMQNKDCSFDGILQLLKQRYDRDKGQQ